MDDGRLTDEVSEIAERLTVAARSWTRPDAMEHRDPATEVELLLETMNELNARRLRIAELEACVREMQRAVPGGSVVDPQVVADELRAIAERHGVKIND